MNTSKRINNSVQKSTLPAWLWILYIIATPVIIFGGYIFYKIQHNQLIVNTESIGLTLLMLLALFTVPILIWKQSQHKYFRSLYLIEIEKKALNAHYEYLVKYANDMIILADGNMHIIEMNDRA